MECKYKLQVKQKVGQIVSDRVHLLFKEFMELPLGGAIEELQQPRTLFDLVNKSLLPNEMTLLNW